MNPVHIPKCLNVISEELVNLILFRFLIRDHNYRRQKCDFFLLLCYLFVYFLFILVYPMNFQRFSIHILEITFRLISVLVFGFPVPVLICGNTIFFFQIAKTGSCSCVLHAACEAVLLIKLQDRSSFQVFMFLKNVIYHRLCWLCWVECNKIK